MDGTVRADAGVERRLCKAEGEGRGEKRAEGSSLACK